MAEPQTLTYRRLSKFNRKQLEQKIDDCFRRADETTEADRRLALLDEADFYIGQLSRRNDSWISRRDLVLEIVVIALIGWEIWMGYTQESYQAADFQKQQHVLSAMQSSMQSTADRLLKMDGTMAAVEVSLQKQIELFYDVQFTVTYSREVKKLVLHNDGRSNVTVWAERIGDDASPLVRFPTPTLIAPGAAYGVDLSALQSAVLSGQARRFSYNFLVKNERNEKFTLSGILNVASQEGAVSLNVPFATILPGWTKD